MIGFHVEVGTGKRYQHNHQQRDHHRGKYFYDSFDHFYYKLLIYYNDVSKNLRQSPSCGSRRGNIICIVWRYINGIKKTGKSFFLFFWRYYIIKRGSTSIAV